MKKNVIVYHGDCPDGFGGAWAAWKKLGSKADYIAARSRGVMDDGLEGRNVYMIDWTYSAPVMAEVRKIVNSLVILDHHVSAKEIMNIADDHVYSTEHSGAVLAWNYFHPGQKTPRILRHVEDRDTWHWKLPRTREICAYLDLHAYDFKDWSKMANEMGSASGRKRIIDAGKLLVSYEDKLIAEAVANAVNVRFEGRKVLAVNSPLFHSQIGNILARKHGPFGIVWWMEHDRVRISLRAVDFDVAKIAEKFGGGGHRLAAGIHLARHAELPWKFL